MIYRKLAEAGWRELRNAPQRQQCCAERAFKQHSAARRSTCHALSLMPGDWSNPLCLDSR